MAEFRHIDKATWRKYLFYVDMIVWGIFAVSVAYLVGNIYLAGVYRGMTEWATQQAAWWRALVGLAFLMGSLSWVFFRFWKNGYLAMRRPY